MVIAKRKPKTKTTRADFELFKRECERCIRILGLTEWRICYEHAKCEEDGNVAECLTSYCGQHVVLRLELDRESLPNTNESIKNTARHEVLELLLSTFAALNNSRWNVSEEETNHIRHELINRLLNSPLFD